MARRAHRKIERGLAIPRQGVADHDPAALHIGPPRPIDRDLDGEFDRLRIIPATARLEAAHEIQDLPDLRAFHPPQGKVASEMALARSFVGDDPDPEPNRGRKRP